ncbi:MAG TPA: DUF1329 domain-containing protein [Candidatus Limnocylindria bacterium]|nr:DUF1329 domain-containing protein [Candidatus Limnocylindria bacterium]
MRRLDWVVLALVMGLIGATPPRAAELTTGELIDQTSWRKAEGLLPPEILAHYERGEYANKFVDWPADKNDHAPEFTAGTEANAGKFAVAPNGSVVDVATGKQPPYLVGFPFPTIDAQDPKAAYKVLWNYFYRTWFYYGNVYAESQINWMSPTGLERRVDVQGSFFYYDGVPREELPASNPNNFLYQNLVLVVRPSDVHGTAALTWRYRDPERRDSVWSYVPALRRVRAISPANRSDGFLGSDESPDDGPFFDGKVEDFEWSLVGQVDQLRIAEETNLQGRAKATWVEGKGWNTDWPDVPFLGYMDKSWKGIAWAPTGAAVLSKRRFWVIEGVPRDKYYLYGKLQLYIDTINFQGAWVRKFGWKNDLLAVHQVLSWNPIPFTRPDGTVDYLQGSNQAYQCVENLKLKRATVAGIKSSPAARLYTHVKFDPDVFSLDALARSGK